MKPELKTRMDLRVVMKLIHSYVIHTFTPTQTSYNDEQMKKIPTPPLSGEHWGGSKFFVDQKELFFILSAQYYLICTNFKKKKNFWFLFFVFCLKIIKTISTSPNLRFGSAPNECPRLGHILNEKSVKWINRHYPRLVREIKIIIFVYLFFSFSFVIFFLKREWLSLKRGPNKFGKVFNLEMCVVLFFLK